MCYLCHLTENFDSSIPPLFTDFSYDNLGIPANPRIADEVARSLSITDWVHRSLFWKTLLGASCTLNHGLTDWVNTLWSLPPKWANSGIDPS